MNPPPCPPPARPARSRPRHLNSVTVAVAAIAALGLHPATGSVLLQDDFSTAGAPPDQGRIYDTLLDTGWNATTGYTATPHPSLWDITANAGGRLENPANVDPTTTGDGDQYTESETPVWQWWTNPLAGVSTDTGLTVSFDYEVGAGDTLTAHFWAVQSGGTPTTTNTWFTNNQGWINGDSGQNEGTSAGGNTPYNLLDSTNPPSTTGSITGALTGGPSAFQWAVDLSSLAIPGVTTVGDIDTFFIAFAANETGGGTTWVDNLTVAVPEASEAALASLAALGLLGFRRRKR